MGDLPVVAEKLAIIPGFPKYFITESGKVYSTIRHNYVKGWVMRGYRYFRLRHNGEVCTKALHTLLLETFVGPCPEGMECRHLNDNRLDNRLENLKWGTPLENGADRVRNRKPALLGPGDFELVNYFCQIAYKFI